MSLIAILFVSLGVQANPMKISCSFPMKNNPVVIDDCASQGSGGFYEIKKPALKQIQFDSRGLAGGSIAKDGCYWLNKKGELKKTHCFDNGADYFQEGLARYIDDKGKFGYMNTQLRVKIPASYTFAFPFENDFAKVCNDCKTVTDPSTEHSTVTGGSWMVINKSGKVVRSCKTEDCN